VQGLVEEGQAAGVFCRRRDAHLMMIAILTLLNSVQQWYRPDGGTDIAHLTDEYVEFVVGGLRCSVATTCACEPETDRGPTRTMTDLEMEDEP